MKRFHVHVSVADLAESTRFYSQLFGQEPSVVQSDYAKWMLDDPRVNFAISARGHPIGVNHLGFQAEDASELAELKQRADNAAGAAVLDQGETACCYAMSEKHWTVDPSGLAWEHYQTMAAIESFGLPFKRDSAEAEDKTASACCVPSAPSTETAATQACCAPPQ